MSSTQYSVKFDGNHTILVIDKKSVGQLNYPKEDVLKTLPERQARKLALLRASRAGNLEKLKFRIMFKDDRSIKEVYTTIWATTEVNIILKHGFSIPIHRIFKVKIA